MNCILCKHGTQQGELRLCLTCEELVKRAHLIQTEMLRIQLEEENNAEKIEVAFFLAQV